MSQPSIQPVRKEVVDYLRYTEHLISAALVSDELPFTQELDLVQQCATEVLRMLGSVAGKEVSH